MNPGETVVAVPATGVAVGGVLRLSASNDGPRRGRINEILFGSFLRTFSQVAA